MTEDPPSPTPGHEWWRHLPTPDAQLYGERLAALAAELKRCADALEKLAAAGFTAVEVHADADSLAEAIAAGQERFKEKLASRRRT